MQTIPIIYIHLGALPEYLTTSIKQATACNDKVFLISDSELRLNKLTCFPVSNYLKEVDSFDSVYKHMSSNSAEFEKICIKRWFILRNFVKQQNIDVCYYTDSDVMIYDDLSKVYERYSSYDASYTMSEVQDNYRWAASACCSYWKYSTLDTFCNYIMGLYSSKGKTPLDEKWAFHQNTKTPGGICDMTLLYLFTKEINFYSLSKVKERAAFDSNMRIAENYYSNEYEMKPLDNNRSIKKVDWKNDKPFGYNKILKEEVQFIALTEYAKVLTEQKGWAGKALSKIKSAIKG